MTIKIKPDTKISNLRCATLTKKRTNIYHKQINKIAPNTHSLIKYIKAVNKDAYNVLCTKETNKRAKYLGLLRLLHI